MTSEDVIHSFYVPAFRLKQDVLPGRYTTLWFRATRTGRHHLFCAEYCGAEHARMGGWIEVLEPDDYAAWLERAGAPAAPGGAGAPGTPGGRGEPLARLGCRTCHLPGDATRAPVLAGLPGRTVTLRDGRTVTADDAYLRRALLDPAADVVAGYPAVMPTYRGQLDEQDVLELLRAMRALTAQDEGEDP
jgi:cytochrome c oxidase subunit 2